MRIIEILYRNFIFSRLLNLERDYFTKKLLSTILAALLVAGELIAIPYQPYTSGVFYNKAAFTAAGIEKEPETWTEFLEVCQKLKDAGYVPLVQDDAYVLYTYGFQLARYIGQEGVEELAVNGGWAQSAEAKKAADDIANLVAQGYIDGLDVYPEGENRIGFEEAAMVVNASWVPGEITNNTDCDLEWGMFNYPAVEGGKDPNTIANIGAQAFAIPSYSEHPQEAFDLSLASQNQWTGSRITLIVLYICLNVPYTTTFLLNFFGTLPRTFEEAAAIDGCGPMKTFWVIMLPLVQPGIITVSIFNFLAVWNEYFMALIFAGSDQLKNVGIGLFNMVSAMKSVATSAVCSPRLSSCSCRPSCSTSS